ncbi:MAG TPA: hypothetical protein VMV62_00305 [Candidatus Paceibacterota bacterium]|nr:hypothetical protein [Candidatus Paceibacterota bacterium]
MHTQKKLVTTGVIALVIGAGVGYAGAGMLNRPAAAPFARGNWNAGGAGSMMRGGAGSGFLTGTVVSKDATGMTLNTRDGSSHVVFVTPDTNVSKSVGGTIADVSVGATVIVSGTTNSDGSVSANLIQLRPAPSPTAAPQAQ